MYLAVVIALLFAICFLSYRLMILQPLSMDLFQRASEVFVGQNPSGDPAYSGLLAGGMSVLAADSTAPRSGPFAGIASLFHSKDLRDPRNLMAVQLPYLPQNSAFPPVHAVPASAALPSRRSGENRPVLEPPEVLMPGYVEETLSEKIQIQIAAIELDEAPIALTGEGPQILVYHSHSREAYMQDPANPYKAAEAFRSNDLDHTVVKVGEVLTDHLNRLGIPTIHDRTEHEQRNFSGSYARSLETLKRQMADHESLQIFLDIHRNAYERKNPDDEVVLIHGERVAKVFVVIGTGEGLLGGFEERPNWQENAKFAIKLTNTINELYPGLAKRVHYKNGRYNQHVSTRAILIEVGSNFTTQAEAKRATQYLAEALSKIVE